MSGTGADNTMRERVGNFRGKLRLTILLNTNRLMLAGVLTVGMFGFLMCLGIFNESLIRTALGQGGLARTIFRAYIGALITGVTLVVTISQLVLSQENGPLGDQRKRMRGALDFRDDVEEFLGTTSPPEPNAFLQMLMDTANDRATEFNECLSDTENEAFEADATDLIESITGNAKTVSDELEDAQFGQYEVVKAVLDFNYAIKIYRARKLRTEYADSLTDETEDALNDLIDLLEFFGPAREHIKTLYFEWELIDLSRQILYVGIPALATTVGLFIYLNAHSFPGTLLGIDTVLWVFNAGIAFASAPFFLLASYMVRIATIAKRTLAIGPFVLRESGRDE